MILENEQKSADVIFSDFGDIRSVLIQYRKFQRITSSLVTVTFLVLVLVMLRLSLLEYSLSPEAY